MTDTAPRRRAYAYIRVSKVGERGDDLISPELQLDHIERWAERENVDLVETVTDLDETGRRFEKRKVQQMIDGISNGVAEMVVLWKWSRWGRNMEKSQVYLGAVERAGGTVRAATEDFDPGTTTGKFTRDQMLLIAELQSNQIGDSWKDTHARRRRNGLPHTAVARFGYTHSRGAGYVVDEDRRGLVADAYREIVNGTSLRSIVMDWNKRGLTTTQGNRWNVTSLGRMLDTGFAAGLIRERSKPPSASTNRKTLADFDIWRDGVHEAIIDRDTWKEFKALRQANSRRRSGRLITATHALTGLVRCGICDRKMQSAYSGRNKKHAWVCPEARDHKTHPFTSASNTLLMQMVRDWLESEAHGGEDIDSRVQEELATRAVVTDVNRLQAEVDRLTAKRKRLANAWTDGMIDREDYEDQRGTIRKDLAQAEDDLSDARRRRLASPPEPERFEGLIATLDRLAPGSMRELLSPVVSYIEVQPGHWSSGQKARIVPTWVVA